MAKQIKKDGFENINENDLAAVAGGSGLDVFRDIVLGTANNVRGVIQNPTSFRNDVNDRLRSAVDGLRHRFGR